MSNELNFSPKELKCSWSGEGIEREKSLRRAKAEKRMSAAHIDSEDSLHESGHLGRLTRFLKLKS
jgi:hypothetical protein